MATSKFYSSTPNTDPTAAQTGTTDVTSARNGACIWAKWLAFACSEGFIDPV